LQCAAGYVEAGRFDSPTRARATKWLGAMDPSSPQMRRKLDPLDGVTARDSRSMQGSQRELETANARAWEGAGRLLFR
jgi:hypothetical protein